MSRKHIRRSMSISKSIINESMQRGILCKCHSAICGPESKAPAGYMRRRLWTSGEGRRAGAASTTLRAAADVVEADIMQGDRNARSRHLGALKIKQAIYRRSQPPFPRA